MIIVILGPPGSGKGTQAELFSKKYEIPHLSSGELFRKEIERKSRIGLEISHYLETGKLVPDDKTVELIHKQLNQIDLFRGVILDGYPRTLYQAKELNRYLEKHNQKLNLSLYLGVPNEQLIKRLKKRGRKDDINSAIDKRLREHEKEIKPLLNFYKQTELLEVIDGSQNITEVLDQIDYVLSNKIMSK